MALSRRTCAVLLISSFTATYAGCTVTMNGGNGGDDPSGSGSGVGVGGSGSAASSSGGDSTSGSGGESSSSSGVGSGGGGIAAPVVLWETPQPWFLAVDPATDSVYWTGRGWNGYLYGVFRIKRDGTGYAHLYDTVDSRGIAVDDSGIYWTHQGGVMKGAKDGSGSAAIFAPVEGTPEHDVVYSSPYCFDPFYLDIALDSTSVFFTGGDCQAVMRIDKNGGGFSLVVSASTPGQDIRLGHGLVIDAARVYSTPTLWAADKDGSSLTNLPQDPPDTMSQGLAVDDTHVYVRGHEQLHRVRKDGSSSDVLATWPSCGSGFYPFNLTIDDTYIYWLEPCSGRILRTPKAGGPLDVLHTGDPLTMLAIVNDDEHIYWTEAVLGQGGRIMKLQKP